MKNLLYCLIPLLFSCQQDKIEKVESVGDWNGIYLELTDPSATGVDFNNQIIETPEINIFTHDAIIQGAGVSILDFNNDGLQDIYFTGNQVSDQLYKNLGDLKFENVSKSAGIEDDLWSSGAAIVDVNGDGFDDIYVTKFFFDDPSKRHNKFFINNGDGTFTDKAKKMGLDDNGYGIMANFFDMDRDGDLDMYLANQPPNSRALKDNYPKEQRFVFTDRLFRNDGGRFSDVTKEAGIVNFNYTLSVTAFDYDKDGWIDIYIACDYDEPDKLYKNMGDGTFIDAAPVALKHMSNFSMGVDIADIDRDGYMDFYVADMVPADNFSNKTNMASMNPQRFWAMVKNGYHYQYMFNSLQLNNGNGSFSEIAQMSGVSHTDWSWSPLFFDVDLDGYSDLLVTNGIIKELRNKDFMIWAKGYVEEQLQKKQPIDPMLISSKAPVEKRANYLYKNNGDLKFSIKSDPWGMGTPGWSQGSAIADLDNDGDADLVINNMNSTADIYQNQSVQAGQHNFLCIELEGELQNLKGIGAKVELTYDNGLKQYAEMTPFRGYMSSSQPKLFFGLGKIEKVDEVKVIWNNGNQTKKTNVDVNQTLVLSESQSLAVKTERPQPLLAVRKINVKDPIMHLENDFDDYEREILIPYKISSLGPVMAGGDIDGDGDEDFFIGSSAGNSAQLYINTGGGIERTQDALFQIDSKYEDGAALFYDIDKDDDLDLYVASGGNEFEHGSLMYQDRLYLNDGKGNFQKSDKLPKINISGGTISAADFDGDGDEDLIVGGRQVPGKYGFPESTIYLEQQPNGAFEDRSEEVAPEFENIGMVSTSAVGDLDKNGKPELILAGEWMSIKIFEFEDGTLVDKTIEYGVENAEGLWNKIVLYDIDGDGFQDIIAGNAGTNIKYSASPERPFKLYVDDFDDNGSNDVYLGYFDNDGNLYPVRGKQCSSEQMPFVKKKFASYNEFGVATVEDVLEGRVDEETVINEAKTFHHCVFYNEGGTSFKQTFLPNEAQIAPSYGISVEDFDKDGKPDIFMVGNLQVREVETTRSDAGTGIVLLSRPNRTFEPLRTSKSGIYADKDARDCMILKNSDGSRLIVVGNNNDEAQFFLLR